MRGIALVLSLRLVLSLLHTGPARAQESPVPLAPVALNRPVVIDTAHLQGGDTTITLFGIKGWGGDPARGLQAFITDNGDRVKCQPQPGRQYTCMMPTGLDVAASALANGAAEALPDAPADYREQEAAAQIAHLGIWAELPAEPVAAPPSSPDAIGALELAPQVLTPYQSQPPPIVPDAGGLLAFDGGVSTAVIDGEPVAFVFAGLAGWGFYDRSRHWHPAPEPYRARLDAFRRMDSGPRVAAFHAPSFYGPGGLPSPLVFNGPGVSARDRLTALGMPMRGSQALPGVFKPRFAQPDAAARPIYGTSVGRTRPALSGSGLPGNRSRLGPNVVGFQRSAPAVPAARPLQGGFARPSFGRR